MPTTATHRRHVHYIQWVTMDFGPNKRWVNTEYVSMLSLRTPFPHGEGMQGRESVVTSSCSWVTLADNTLVAISAWDSVLLHPMTAAFGWILKKSSTRGVWHVHSVKVEELVSPLVQMWALPHSKSGSWVIAWNSRWMLSGPCIGRIIKTGSETVPAT